MGGQVKCRKFFVFKQKKQLQIYWERYRFSSGRAENRVELRHCPSPQIRRCKQLADSVCAARRNLGAEFNIRRVNLRKEEIILKANVDVPGRIWPCSESLSLSEEKSRAGMSSSICAASRAPVEVMGTSTRWAAAAAETSGNRLYYVSCMPMWGGTQMKRGKAT